MSYCSGCGTKIGQPGCFCPIHNNLVQVTAYRNSEGLVFATASDAKRHEVFTRVEQAMTRTGMGPSDRHVNGMNWVLANINKLAELLRDYPLKERVL